MKGKTTRTPTRVHTRQIDRAIARQQMKNIGMRRVAKHSYYGNLWERVRTGSYFSEHWHEYCVGGDK